MRINAYDDGPLPGRGNDRGPKILQDFPYLTPEDVQACYGFAADRERQGIVAPQVKLLFDHNLSARLVTRLADLHPDSSHAFSPGLDQASDAALSQLGNAIGQID
jgi:hypothetical protein